MMCVVSLLRQCLGYWLCLCWRLGRVSTIQALFDKCWNCQNCNPKSNQLVIFKVVLVKLLFLHPNLPKKRGRTIYSDPPVHRFQSLSGHFINHCRHESPYEWDLPTKLTLVRRTNYVGLEWTQCNDHLNLSVDFTMVCVWSRISTRIFDIPSEVTASQKIKRNGNAH